MRSRRDRTRSRQLAALRSQPSPLRLISPANSSLYNILRFRTGNNPASKRIYCRVATATAGSSLLRQQRGAGVGENLAAQRDVLVAGVLRVVMADAADTGHEQ